MEKHGKAWKRSGVIGIGLLSLSILQGCANMEIINCTASGSVSGGSSGGVQGEISGGCSFKKIPETEQASVWDRFISTLFAYNPTSILDLDFSQFSISVGLTGGQVTTSSPDIDVMLYDDSENLIAHNTFSGTLSNGILVLSQPETVKGWAQNFENATASISISVETLEMQQSFDVMTLSTAFFRRNEKLASATTTYSSGGTCAGCSGEWEIE